MVINTYIVLHCGSTMQTLILKEEGRSVSSRLRELFITEEVTGLLDESVRDCWLREEKSCNMDNLERAKMLIILRIDIEPHFYN